MMMLTMTMMMMMMAALLSWFRGVAGACNPRSWDAIEWSGSGTAQLSTTVWAHFVEEWRPHDAHHSYP
jgi:hypothetical protein